MDFCSLDEFTKSVISIWVSIGSYLLIGLLVGLLMEIIDRGYFPLGLIFGLFAWPLCLFVIFGALFHLGYLGFIGLFKKNTFDLIGREWP